MAFHKKNYTTDDTYTANRSVKNIKQDADISMGKLENSNFNLDISNCYAGTSSTLVRCYYIKFFHQVAVLAN